METVTRPLIRSNVPSEEKAARQIVKYTFFKVDAAWRRLPVEERTAHKEEFAGVLENFDERVVLLTYSTVGTRGDCDFLIWSVSENLEAVRQLVTALFSTRLGAYLATPYSYLAMTKRSRYVDKHTHEGQEGKRARLHPIGAKYLFVYPMVKKREWYRLSVEERQRAMNEHFEIGHRFPSVKINTTYSFGLDDQEFVVAFETDSPSDFLDLVETLRPSESSKYTERETPIFTCLAMEPRAMLDALGGLPDER
jgi:chlorite dismutase